MTLGTLPAPPGSVNPLHYLYVINFFGGNPSDTVKGAQGRPFVYPVPGQLSLSADPCDQLRLQRLTLRAADGTAFAGRLVTHDTGSGKPLEHYALWIPLQPLAHDTLYTATAELTLNGKAQTRQWQFLTRAAAPLTLTPSATALDATPGSRLSVRLTGGTGTGLTVSHAGHRYQFHGKTNPKTSFVIPSHVAPDTLVLTRNTTPCRKPPLNCEVIVKGNDSSGSEVLLSLPVN